MVKNLTAKGRKLVTIVDPHIKKDDNFPVYSQLKANDMFVKDRSGNDFDGWCWPGERPSDAPTPRCGCVLSIPTVNRGFPMFYLV